MKRSSGTVWPLDRARVPGVRSAPGARAVRCTWPSMRPPVALPYATVGPLASCWLHVLPVLKTVRMPRLASCCDAAMFASKSASCEIAPSGPSGWHTAPSRFSVSATLKPAAAYASRSATLGGHQAWMTKRRRPLENQRGRHESAAARHGSGVARE